MHGSLHVHKEKRLYFYISIATKFLIDFPIGLLEHPPFGGRQGEEIAKPPSRLIEGWFRKAPRSQAAKPQVFILNFKSYPEFRMCTWEGVSQKSTCVAKLRVEELQVQGLHVRIDIGGYISGLTSEPKGSKVPTATKYGFCSSYFFRGLNKYSLKRCFGPFL